MPRGVIDETPPIRDDYQLAIVEGDYFKDKLRPKQFLHIDQSECILCEGCVDICPWKCIHYLSLSAISEGVNVDHPAEDDSDEQRRHHVAQGEREHESHHGWNDRPEAVVGSVGGEAAGYGETARQEDQCQDHPDPAAAASICHWPSGAGCGCGCAHAG